jgi:hypothetical protein
MNFAFNTRRCQRPTYPRAIAPATAKSPNTPGSGSDTAAVYRAVLDAIYPSRRNEKLRVVLSELTRSECTQATTCLAESLDSLRSREPIESGTIANFRGGNQLASLIPLDFGYRGDIVPLPAGEREFLEEQAQIYEGPLRYAVDSKDPPLWRMLLKAYPNARGMVSLSRVGFDSNHSEGLVEVTVLEKTGTKKLLLLLRREDGRWFVVARQ